ncbi:MAG: ComF family protein [Patescibacteria group bacterium]|nr:ComF family protein [Patescibacteria group bacterium]
MIDIVFPRLCLSCGFPGLFLCGRCRDRLEHIKDTACFYCEKKTPWGQVHTRCVRHGEIDGLLAAVWYSETIRKVIHSIKYGGAYAAVPEVFWGLSPLALANLGKLLRHTGPLGIQPVPLHPSRMRERGFNQAALLARMLVRLTGMAAVNVLVRNKSTSAQAGTTSRVARILNMRGAFSVSTSLPCRGILLVDDVVTTGSTVKEAARTLKKAGAEAVYVWCLARD